MLIAFIFIGCTFNPPPIYNAPDPQSTLNNKTILDLPYEQAWEKTISVLFHDGQLISISDKENGIITTNKKTIRLNEKQADCGSIWRFFYLVDQSTMSQAAYSIHLLSEKNDKTEITVNTHIHALVYSTDERQTKQLTCVSLGYLETYLIRKLKKSSWQSAK